LNLSANIAPSISHFTELFQVEAMATITAAVTEMGVSFDSIVDQLTAGVCALRMEIAIFLLAFAVHALLFGKHSLIRNKKGTQTKSQASFPMPEENPGGRKNNPQKPLRSVKMLSGDDICRGCSGKPEAAIANLRVHLEDVQDDEVVPTLVALLQSAGRSPTVELLRAVRGAAKEHGLEMNSTLGEVLLRGCYSAHLTVEFEALLADIEA